MDPHASLAGATSELDHRLAQQDPSCLGELLEKYGDELEAHLCLEMHEQLDEDERDQAITDALVNALERSKPFDPAVASAGTFLRRLAVWAAKAYLRRRRSELKMLVAEERLEAVTEKWIGVEVPPESRVLVERLRAAIMNLRESYRLAVLGWMRYGDRGYREALAKQLRVTEGTVGQWFVRAKAELKFVLGDQID